MSNSEFSVSEHVLKDGLINSESKLSWVKPMLLDLRSLINGARITRFTMAMCKKASVVPLLSTGIEQFNYRVYWKCAYFQEKKQYCNSGKEWEILWQIIADWANTWYSLEWETKGKCLALSVSLIQHLYSIFEHTCYPSRTRRTWQQFKIRYKNIVQPGKV